MIVQRRRQQLAVSHPEEGRGRALEHHLLRRHQQRLVIAALAREPAGEHVGGVGQRLDAVEHERRHVGDPPQGDAVRQLRQRLDHRQAPAAAGDQHAQQAIVGARLGQQRVRVGLHRVALQGQPQVRRRALHARHVLVQGKGPPAIQAHDLEDAVAAQQAFVGHWDARVIQRDERAYLVHEPAR